MNRLLGYSIVLACSLTIMSCETSEQIIEQPETPLPVMTYSVSEVSEIRKSHNVDQQAMAVEGVLSVGVSGNSNDDAWIAIQCKDAKAVENVRAVLGDSLAGVPIHFSLSDTIRAQ